MAYPGSKGYYVKQLKDMGVRQYEGRRLETYKAHVLYNLYSRLTNKVAGS